MKASGKVVVAILWIGLVSHVQGLAAVEWISEEIVRDQSFDRLQHFTLGDAVPAEEYYGYTALPVNDPLDIQVSDDPAFEYMAVSPYYKVFFKGSTARMSVTGAWIEFEVAAQTLGDVQRTESVIEQSSLSVPGLFESADLLYEVESSLLTESLILKKPREFDRFIQNISWEGITPEAHEDGSIVFSDEYDEVVKILPPFMKDAQGDMCFDVHYELVETAGGYQLHKVIEENGLLWLKQAVYPVVIDPSMQVLEDAWESSGLTPYGQYFQNLKEYVNSANGYLTVTQTDLVIPG